MLRHDELHKKFSSVVGDEIIAILRSKGTRLKTDAILSAYFAKYGSDSSSTIKPKLSEMVKLGTLTSLRGTGGGYGLPEWT